MKVDPITFRAVVEEITVPGVTREVLESNPVFAVHKAIDVVGLQPNFEFRKNTNHRYEIEDPNNVMEQTTDDIGSIFHPNIFYTEENGRHYLIGTNTPAAAEVSFNYDDPRNVHFCSEKMLMMLLTGMRVQFSDTMKT
jgi:hypothetical protein